jgi:hypothetical protein
MGHMHKPIQGYEGLYEISTSGKIKILKPIHFSKKENPFIVPYKQKSTTGITYYYSVKLFKGNKSRHHLLHVLLGKAFVPGYRPGLIINHKDGNGLNNALNNLEWVTTRGNALHARYILKRNVHRSSMPIKIIYANGKEQRFNSMNEICKELKIGYSLIWKSLYGMKIDRDYRFEHSEEYVPEYS